MNLINWQISKEIVIVLLQLLLDREWNENWIGDYAQVGFDLDFNWILVETVAPAESARYKRLVSLAVLL